MVPAKETEQINMLEVMALWLAVQTFAKSDHKTQAYMHLKMGNVSALTHVNHMGELVLWT